MKEPNEDRREPDREEAERLYKEFLQENLELVEQEGIALYLSGEPADPDMIVSHTIREAGNYVCHYKEDAKGAITGLFFEKRQNEKN